MSEDQALEIPTVDPVEAARRVKDGALLIDVREQDEWDETRIPEAELKPLSLADTWYRDLPSDQDIIFYCRSGQRSGQIVHALIERAGLSNVTNMSGGIIAWVANELPIES